MTTIIRRKRLGMSSVKGICEASKKGIQWVRNDKRLPPDDLYIRWGCVSNVPTRNVLNTAASIRQVSNKLEFRRTLEEYELCPATWFDYNDVPDDCVNSGVIVRTKTHHQGRGLWLIHGREDLKERCLLMGKGNYYLSIFVRKVAEYRVFVVQGRAVCVAQKTPANPDAIAWNVNKGGRFDNVRWRDWNVKAVSTAIEAFNLSGLDFGGVDVMEDINGDCTVLEINSAPSLTSPYRQQCMAKAFDYIVDNGKQRIPLVKKLGAYLKFIHPCIDNKAHVLQQEEV